MKQIFSLVLIGVVLGLAAGNNLHPRCKHQFSTVVSANCRRLWQCVWGQPVRMPNCASGLIFSRRYHVCVRRGGEFDDCKKHTAKGGCTDSPCFNGGTCSVPNDHSPEYTCICPPEYTGDNCEEEIKTLNIAELCVKDPSLVLPHPEKCQLYYNCSHVYEYVPAYFEQYMMECQYPYQFSETEKTCKTFKEVLCGTRLVYKDACSYLTNQCNGPHCIPCHVYNPSCEGKADGMHVYQGRSGSPYFMICEFERTVETGLCPVDDKGRQLYVKDGKCSGTKPEV